MEWLNLYGAITRLVTDLKTYFATLINGAVQISQGGTGGTTAALARTNLSVPSTTDLANVGSSIAPVESTTATANHASGDYFMLGNVLMRATVAIATGEQITTSNATPATIQGQIDTLRDSVVTSQENMHGRFQSFGGSDQLFGIGGVVINETNAYKGHRASLIVKDRAISLFDHSTNSWIWFDVKPAQPISFSTNLNNEVNGPFTAQGGVTSNLPSSITAGIWDGFTLSSPDGVYRHQMIFFDTTMMGRRRDSSGWKTWRTYTST